MGRVLMFVVPLVLTIYALVDCLQTDESAVRSIPKLWWIMLIVFVWVVGPLAWLIAGRPQSIVPPSLGGPQRGERPGPGHLRDNRPRGPEDDPDFLRGL